MKAADLLATARDLVSVEAGIASEFGAKKNLLVALIDQRMQERPDIEALVGPDNLQMMKDNHANHALFMESLLRNYQPEVLVNTVLWVFRAYRSRRFHPNYWAAQLNAWVELIQQELSSESAAAILPFYQWMIVHIPQFTLLTDAAVEGDAA